MINYILRNRIKTIFLISFWIKKHQCDRLKKRKNRFDDNYTVNRSCPITSYTFYWELEMGFLFQKLLFLYALRLTKISDSYEANKAVNNFKVIQNDLDLILKIESILIDFRQWSLNRSTYQVKKLILKTYGFFSRFIHKGPFKFWKRTCQSYFSKTSKEWSPLYPSNPGKTTDFNSWTNN